MINFILSFVGAFIGTLVAFTLMKSEKAQKIKDRAKARTKKPVKFLPTPTPDEIEELEEPSWLTDLKNKLKKDEGSTHKTTGKEV